MNVLSLFDGISAGQLALQKSGIKANNYYAAEIDKYAMQITQKNFPITIQLGDVTKIKGSDLSDIDALIGGSPCFTADTLIITENSIKKIKDVVVGDFVLTHNNRFRKVLSVGGNKNKDIISVFMQGIVKTETTPEHPFYVREMSRGWDNEKRRNYRKFSEPFWKKAIDLKKGDFVGVNILNKNENTYNLTEEDAYIIGRYIADGHTRKDYRVSENRGNDRYWQLILSIGDHKVDIFKDKIKNNHFSCYKHSNSTCRIVFSSKRLVEIVEHNCGCGASNKHISMNLLKLPKELLKCLIEGYLDGDGCVNGHVDSFTTISSTLITTLSLAIAKVYNIGFSYSLNTRLKKHIIEGREVNQKPTHTLRFCKSVTKQANYKIIDGIVWLPFKKIINENHKKDVFNIEVEEDNSYTANGVIVHNCTSFSKAGNQKGFEGESGLFWQYVRILEEVKPTYFLLENVQMKKEWEDIITNALGVQPIRINSRLVSAQNRPRVYWTNVPNVTQPEDKGILLKDVIQPLAEIEEKYFLSPEALDYMGRLRNGKPRYEYHKNEIDGKAACLTANMYKGVPYGVIKIPEATKKGFAEIHPNEGLDLTYINSSTRRGRRMEDKSNCLTAISHEYCWYDGYIVRKLTPIECERLQTFPDNYTAGVSNSQRYKMIGNSWTVDVISHILKNIP